MSGKRISFIGTDLNDRWRRSGRTLGLYAKAGSELGRLPTTRPIAGFTEAWAAMLFVNTIFIGSG